MNFNNGLLFLALAVLLAFSFSDASNLKPRKLISRAVARSKPALAQKEDLDAFESCVFSCLDDQVLFDDCAELLSSFRIDVNCIHSCGSSNPAGYFESSESLGITPDCSTATTFTCTPAEVCVANYFDVDSETEETFWGDGGTCPSTCAAIGGESSFTTCLAGDMKVDLMNSGSRLVEDLQIGDMVHVGEGKYEPVLWQTQHRNSEGVRGNQFVQAMFVEIEFENGNKVSLTPNHFTVTANGEVLAGSVKVGDVLDSQVVVDITRKFKTGAYNPQTISQKIEVNGVIVSTRTEHSPPHFVMTAVFSFLSVVQTVLPAGVYTSFVSNLSEFVLEPALFGTNPGLFSLINSMVFVGMVIGASKVWKKI